MASHRLLISVNNTHYQVIFLQGVDDLNGHSEYLVEVDTLDLAPLQNGLGQTVSLTFIADDDHSRVLNACLLSIEDKGVIGANPKQADGLKRRYQLTLGTRLSLLEQTEHSRVFVDTDLKDVLYTVLAGAGYHGAQIEFSLAKPLPAAPQIVQAMESNAAFFKRLLSQYGLYYRVTSTGADAGIMITDNNLSSPYLARGLIEVHHASGFNSQLAESALENSNGRPNFVGFSHCQVKHQYQRGLTKAMAIDEHAAQDELADYNLAQPVSTSLAQAAQVGEDQTLATHRFAQVITLTGNVPDIFAGCSFSLNDQSAVNASGDYLCVSVKHKSQQPSDETSQDGLSQYHCEVVAIPRGTAFKLPYEAFSPLPMVFSASVESIQPAPTLTETGEYYAKIRFDDTAQGPLSSTQPLKKLVSYACANQPHATGWHFPLAHDSQVLLGCVNNDPSQAYIIGFDMNQAQPAVVNSSNASQNRILSRSGHELRFDDDEQTPTIILQTLGSEHYFELNANTAGKHYIEWVSRLGNISLHAAGKLLLENSEGNIDFQVDGHQHIDAKHSVAIEVKADHISKQDSLSIQSATHLHHTAQKVNLSSKKQTSLLSGRSIKTQANSKILWQSAQGNMAINASQGATIVNAQGNISIKGSGSGDITLFNQGGMIKLDSRGNVELIGKDVLTLNGKMIILDGEVTYKNASPQTASEPNAASPSNISRIADLNLAGNTQLDVSQHVIELEYTYQDGEAVQNAPYIVELADGTKIEGELDNSGKATIEGAPTGQYTVQLGEDTREYQPLDTTKPNPLFGKITPQVAATMVENDDTSLLDEAGDLASQAGDWLWGTLQGDFNENPSTSQIVVGTIISMIPVVDQVMDCRDVCANIFLLVDDKEANDTDGWIALTLTGIGFIPVLGSAVKGVGKIIVKNPKQSISLAAAALRKLGKGDPIAYIKNIDWKDLGKQGAELIKEKIMVMREALNAILNSSSVKWALEKETLENLSLQSQQLADILPKVDKGIEEATAVIERKVKKALDEYTGEMPRVGKTGDVKKVKADELDAPKGNDMKGAKAPTFDYTKARKLKKGEKLGDYGEEIVEDMLRLEGYDTFYRVQNKSGNGVDIVAKHNDGSILKAEVKSTKQDKLWNNGDPKSIPLSKPQREMGGEAYSTDRLQRAVNKDDGYTDGVVDIEARKAQKVIKKAKRNGKEVKNLKFDVYLNKEGKLMSKPIERSWVAKPAHVKKGKA